MSDQVTITISRDNALMLLGWINAHRPPGDWEPEFLMPFIVATKMAVSGE